MFLLDNASHFILVDRVTEPDRKSGLPGVNNAIKFKAPDRKHEIFINTTREKEFIGHL